MKGYYKNPEVGGSASDRNNFLHSGDLQVSGRKRQFTASPDISRIRIIRGGENIYPREIEEFLYKLDGVKDVQVAGIPSIW